MTQELSSSRRKPGATTPAAGGANISGSQASESLVEGGTTRAVPSAEGLAVVEAVKRDEAPVDPASDEIPIWLDGTESLLERALIAEEIAAGCGKELVDFYDKVYKIAQPKFTPIGLDKCLEIIAQQQTRIEFLQVELETTELRIASLEANRSLPLDEPVVKESLTTAADILNAAAGHMAARASTYDKPGGERSMGKAVAMFNACVDRDLSEAEGWLLLQCLKDVRLFQRPGYNADSAEDCTAYSALKAEAKAREAA